MEKLMDELLEAQQVLRKVGKLDIVPAVLKGKISV